MLPQPTRLPRKRRSTAPGDHPGREGGRQHGQHRGRSRTRRLLPDHRLFLARRLFEDQVGVRAADPERRHTRPARLIARGPLLCFPEQLHVPGRPVHVRGRRLGVQRPGQDAVPHRQHHLDHTGDTGRLLGVADVGLHRAQPQRPVPVRAFLTVGGQQRTRLDRVAERGSGAVRLHHIHIGRGDLCVRQGRADDAALRGTVRRGQAVRGAVLVDRAAADHREHLMPVAPCIREAFQQHHARALAPADAVGLVRERLAPAAGRHAALLGEVHERAGRGHDRDAAGQRHRALTGAQGLHRLVQRDQGGGAGGVHRHRRARQAQAVGDAAGGDRRDGAGEPVPVQALIVSREAAVIAGVAGADEDTGGRAVQG